LGQGKPQLRNLAQSARGNRIGRLKGYGNAIVPQVAAEFVMAFMDCKPN
jgi:DNA (cytosine-5)-methyltransferase 1